MPSYRAIPNFHLSKLPTTTKTALTCFALALLAAILFVTIAVFGERTDYTTRGVQANFAGDERVTQETGHRFKRMHAEPTQRAVYDIVHPHSFMIPILYFVLCHLMEMTSGPRSFKMAVYLVSFAGMMLVIATPLLVWTKIALAPLVIPAVLAMGSGFVLMLVVPVWQMWFPPRNAP